MCVSSRLSTSASCELISSCAVSSAASITSPEFCCRNSLSMLKSPASACRKASRRRTRICRKLIIASLRAIVIHLLSFGPQDAEPPLACGDSNQPQLFASLTLVIPVFVPANSQLVRALCSSGKLLPALHNPCKTIQNIVRGPATLLGTVACRKQCHLSHHRKSQIIYFQWVI